MSERVTGTVNLLRPTFHTISHIEYIVKLVNDAILAVMGEALLI